MKNKVMKKILMIMLSSTILMGSASVTAFAQANENAEQTEAVEQVIEEQPAEQPTTEETPFSTPGNGQLVDDKENDSSKQFLTVQTSPLVQKAMDDVEKYFDSKQEITKIEEKAVEDKSVPKENLSQPKSRKESVLQALRERQAKIKEQEQNMSKEKSKAHKKGDVTL